VYAAIIERVASRVCCKSEGDIWTECMRHKEVLVGVSHVINIIVHVMEGISESAGSFRRCDLIWSPESGVWVWPASRARSPHCNNDRDR